MWRGAGPEGLRSLEWVGGLGLGNVMITGKAWGRQQWGGGGGQGRMCSQTVSLVQQPTAFLHGLPCTHSSPRPCVLSTQERQRGLRTQSSGGWRRRPTVPSRERSSPASRLTTPCSSMSSPVCCSATVRSCMEISPSASASMKWKICGRARRQPGAHAREGGAAWAPAESLSASSCDLERRCGQPGGVSGCGCGCVWG